MPLRENRYGKSRVRMLKVSRDRGRVREIEAAILFEGDFEPAHFAGDNTAVLPTDTMKNTVYALGKDHPLDTVESFALDLARHFLRDNAALRRASVTIASPAWRRLEATDAFARDGSDIETAGVTASADRVEVTGGLRDLVILKTTRSGFARFRCDALTTLADTDDRLLGTSLTAAWTFDSPDADYAAARHACRAALLETFGAHDSRSVQHTLHAMAEAALDATPAIRRIHLSMPNRHNLLVDLSPFGLENDNEVFMPVDEPYGVIEAAVERAGREGR